MAAAGDDRKRNVQPWPFLCDKPRHSEPPGRGLRAGGPWYNDFKPWHSGKKEAQLCGIAIYFEGRGFIYQVGRRRGSDIESVEGRSIRQYEARCRQWGIGRVLYDLNTIWVEIEKRGRSFVIKDSERVKLDNAYLSALKRLGLTPAAACGIQSLLTPKTLPGQTAPGENDRLQQIRSQSREIPSPACIGSAKSRPACDTERFTADSVRTAKQSDRFPHSPLLPAAGWRQRTDCYVVPEHQGTGRYERQQQTLVTLRAPDGKQIPAFARGARPELSAGTVLSNVKITMRQQDTVAFYVLESYEIVPQEDRAA